VLREELERAVRLTNKLSKLLQRVMPGEALFFWLLGRDEEVHALVGAIVSDWSEGTVDSSLAAYRIGTYVGELERKLHDIYRASIRPRLAHASGRDRRGVLCTEIEATVHDA
jgi:hypothetical protein